MANLLEVARQQTAVRQINNRVVTLVNNLGADSTIVQNYYAKMQATVPSDFLSTNKEGILQIRQPKKLLEQGVNMSQFKEEFTTWKKVKEEYEESYKRAMGDNTTIDNYSIKDFISDMDAIQHELYNLYPPKTEEESKAIEIMQKTGRRKTYIELHEVADTIRKRIQGVFDNGNNLYRPTIFEN